MSSWTTRVGALAGWHYPKRYPLEEIGKMMHKRGKLVI